MENYGRLDLATGLSSRVTDFLRALDQLVAVAIDGEIDVVIFAGDAYRNRDPSLTYQREFSRRIGRLAAHGIPVILLVGNHDLPNAIGRATPLDIYDTLAIERVHVFAEPSVKTIPTRHGPLQIVALPWVRRELYLTAEQLRTRSVDDLNLDVDEIFSQWLQQRAAEIDRTIPAVLVAHVTIAGATYGSERKVLFGHDLVLTRAAVDRPEFGYVALGHIHKQQVLGAVTPIVYSGSTERIDFGEEKEAKGFILAEIEAGQPARFRFESLPTRPFMTVDVVLGEADPTEAILAAIERQRVAGAVVRIQVEGSAEQLRRVRRGDIVQAVRDAYYFAGIHQKLTQEERTRSAQAWSEGKSPRDILVHYFESRKISGDRLKKLMAAAEEVMATRETTQR